LALITATLAEVVLTMPPTQLAKILPGTKILMDRAFSAHAQYYPNLNAMVLSYARKQFMSDESESDWEKSVLR
jgi:hypothetical protein